jgi:hypothetical protein
MTDKTCTLQFAAGVDFPTTAEKALSATNHEVRRTYTDLAEHWRALAGQTEFLERYA